MNTREFRSRARRFTSTLLVGLACGTLGSGCSDPPPDAPAEYEALLAYLFTYMEDDSGKLAEGLETLAAWRRDAAQRERVLEGFSIRVLDEAAVDMLDEQDRSAEALVGISVLTPSPHSPEALAGLLTWTGFHEVIQDNFDVYERTFREDPTCFASRECDWVEADSRTESKWAGLISVKTDYTIQFRWVETPSGWMLLHRFWLKAPAKGSCCGLQMFGNFYIGVTMPNEDGTADRIHANWFRVDGGDFGFLAGDPAARVVANTRTDAERLDRWLSEHPPAPMP